MSEISTRLRHELDDVPVARIAEYLCGRLELDDGERLLQLVFRDGRYERMTRWTAERDGPKIGRSAHGAIDKS